MVTEVATLGELEALVSLFEQVLEASTSGEWTWAATATATHDEAVAFYREAIRHHESGTLHAVQARLADGTERLIAVTGNAPQSATHAKLIVLLHRFAPDLLEIFKGIIDREQPGNVTFAQVSEAAQLLRTLMTAPAVTNALAGVLSGTERGLLDRAVDVLTRLPPTSQS